MADTDMENIMLKSYNCYLSSRSFYSRTALLFLILSLFSISAMTADNSKEQSIENFGEGAFTKIPDEYRPFLFAPKKDLKWFEDAKFGIFICWGTVFNCGDRNRLGT